jgi:hypothetical protein
MKHLPFLALLAMLLGASNAMAAESYDNCTGTIASLPAVISTAGTWCLKQDLTTSMASGNAITVSNNNVTIDCNDFKVDGLAGGIGTSANGILASSRLNTTIRHCNIRGFYMGVKLLGTGGGNVIEDNRLDGNTYIGLYVQGDGSVIRRNQVLDTGGSTVSAPAYGINTVYSVDVLNNAVSGVTARTGGAGAAYGIASSSNTGGSINGNRVRDLLPDTGKSAYAVFNGASGRLVMRDNDLVGNGSAGTVGVICSNATGRAKNNVIDGFATTISGCGDAGTNDQTH